MGGDVLSRWPVKSTITYQGPWVDVHSRAPSGRARFMSFAKHGSVQRWSFPVSRVVPLGGPEWSSTWGPRRGPVDLWMKCSRPEGRAG